MNQLGISLNEPATYIQIWEWIQISVPNLIVVLLMLLVFALALVAPFPKGEDA